MTASCDALTLASHVQLLFLEFDALVTKYERRCGAFKVDTIGDAYVVAAWLGARGGEGGAETDAGFPSPGKDVEVLR